MEHSINLVQAVINIIGTAVPLAIMGAAAVSKLVTKMALMEAELRRLVDIVDRQNGRIRALELAAARQRAGDQHHD